MIKGIRGAITVDKNTQDSLKEAVIELLARMIDENNIDIEQISHVIFTTTKDINVDFPAKFARIHCGFKNTAMMCFNELDVPNSLKMCLRVLIVYNCNDNFIPKFIYLKGAKDLRN